MRRFACAFEDVAVALTGELVPSRVVSVPMHQALRAAAPLPRPTLNVPCRLPALANHQVFRHLRILMSMSDGNLTLCGDALSRLSEASTALLRRGPGLRRQSRRRSDSTEVSLHRPLGSRRLQHSSSTQSRRVHHATRAAHHSWQNRPCFL
jgi:hypothetical protein